LPENTNNDAGVLRDDVLSALLGTIRLSGSLQFCLVSSGDFQTDAAPSLAALSAGASGTMPFHVVVEGDCWLKLDGTTFTLEAGDAVVFPFGAGHQIGVGEDGMLVIPTRDLPPKPWREIPVVRYGDGDGQTVRLLCGYLQCDAINFAPLRHALPEMIHVRAREAESPDWLLATIRQMVAEVERPRAGGVSMLPRLTEIIFIEILRHRIIEARGAGGWLAALADPALAKCLSLIHDDPARDWSLQELSAACGASRSTLAERFHEVLDTSPMKYVRDWRLYLAGVALRTSGRSIAAVAHEAGYATEASFNRAFSRTHGMPPSRWRELAKA
jgi:AraC-like DNA-binding protein